MEQEREMVKKEGNQTRRQLVLVPCPFQGHMNPMLQLATVLYSKGFAIVIALAHPQSHFPATSNHPDFTFHPLSDSKPLTSGDIVSALSSYELNCTDSLLDLLTKMSEKAAVEEERWPCVVYDALMYFAQSVADKLKIPSFVLQTSCAASLNNFFAYPRLNEEGYLPVQESKLLELVPGRHPLRFQDIGVADSRGVDAVLKLVTKLKVVAKSSAVIYNSMDCLENSTLSELQRQCQIPMLAIGPLHKMAPASSFSFLKEDNSCIAWLDKQIDNSVLYVSFGSIAFVSKKDLEEMAWGLANSKQPFLWVIRPGLVPGSETDDLSFPDGFIQSVGERGCIVKWAPQREVLAHKAVGGFWSHCGWNSTIESISEGVPMICRPFMVDQRVIARHVSDVWGFGFQLEGDLERGVIEKAVKRLLVEEEGKIVRQRADELKTKAEISISEGGSSYNSLNQLVDLMSMQK